MDLTPLSFTPVGADTAIDYAATAGTTNRDLYFPGELSTWIEELEDIDVPYISFNPDWRTLVGTYTMKAEFKLTSVWN